MEQLEKQTMNPDHKSWSEKLPLNHLKGVLLTAILAILAAFIAKLPLLSLTGVMILSIFIGMIYKHFLPIPTGTEIGIEFSSKKLLRIGIVLMGARLDLAQILSVGRSILWTDVLVVTFTLVVMLTLGKQFGLEQRFSTLLAVGTAICGAAAIAAIAPLIKARNDQMAIAVAFIAIIGTVGTVFYSILYATTSLDPHFYGTLVGATLHEIAHVVAASIPAGEASADMAILVKMGRVALLIPVALLIGGYVSYKNRKDNQQRNSLKNLPIPGFIFGFLAMSLLNTSGILPTSLVDILISISIFLLSMAMAGLGLSIVMNDFKKVGKKAVLVGVLGSLLLIIFGWLIIR